MDTTRLNQLIKNGEDNKVDLKQEWYSKNKRIDLAIDILNFVNTIHHDDCYIIIGIEDETKNIIGVNQEDPNRFNTEKLTDYIRNLPLTGQFIPKVEVFTRFIDGKTIDIITIFNTSNTPVYLYKNYKKGKKSIGAGQIFSRNQSTNTPIDNTAPDYITERLWKKRFKLDQNIEIQYKKILKDSSNWSFSDSYNGNPMRFIYNLNPNFYIEFLDDIDYRDKVVSMSLNAVRLDIGWQLASLKFNHLEIKSFLVYLLDGARFYQVSPNSGFLKNNEGPVPYGYNFYYIDSLRYNLNEMLWNNPYFINQAHYYDKDSVMNGAVLYRSETEKGVVEEKILEKYNVSAEITPSKAEIETVKERIKADVFECNTELNNTEHYLKRLHLSTLINKYTNSHFNKI